MDKTLLLKHHPQKEKAVMQFFNQAINEVKALFFAEDIDKVVGIRIQMVAAFTMVEVLSNFSDCYRNKAGKNRTHKDRMTEWLDEFCFTDANETFKNNPKFAKVGIKAILDLRHSLVHFFGLSPQKVGNGIALGSNDMNEASFERFSSGFGPGVSTFKPIDFFNLFKDGGIIMLNQMIENIDLSKRDEAKKWEHVEGIDRIFVKFNKEGAMQILVPKVAP